MTWISAAPWLWVVSSLALAGTPDYNAFSNPDGYIASKEQTLAAWAMLRDPEQLEAVYADAEKGNARATRVFQQLEATLGASGEEVAERANRPGCLLPVYRELSGSCIPDWSFLDFLSPDRPGGIRLRSAIFRAFANRSRERGRENQAILSAVNGLLSVQLARSILVAEAGARTAALAAENTTKVVAPATRGAGVQPSVRDPRLNNLIKDLYKGAQTAKPIGTGSTADAILHEARTGQSVGGKLHTQKGEQYARALKKWLDRNPGASAEDRAAAQAVLDDLQNALAGK